MDNSDPPPNPDNLGTPCGYSQVRQVPFNPYEYDNTQGMNPTGFASMPIPVAAPNQFPPIKDAPANLRVRQPDHELQLGLLDVQYHQKKHKGIRDMALLDANHLQENVGAGMKASRAAYSVLERHVKDRLPYVHVSAERLQAATGMRNELPFCKF